jgi:signal transduction histidine kinase
VNIRVKVFLIFSIIAIFTFTASYYVAGSSIRKIVNLQTEQTLSSSLYTNYSIVKNLIDQFPTNLSMEIKVRELVPVIENGISYDIDKSSNAIFSAMELDYLVVKKNADFLFTKTNYKGLDVKINFNVLIPQIVTPLYTDNGLLLLTEYIDSKNPEINIIAGKLINDLFLEKLYQEDVNLVIYWNGKVLTGTNKIFNEPIPEPLMGMQVTNDFKPSDTFLIKWQDRSYKVKYHPVISYTGNNLVIATMSSTLFEDKVFVETIQNLILFLGIFIAVLLLVSFYISRDIMDPFYALAAGISKKDKKSIKELLTRKDEIGNLANEFWNITEDLLKQQEQKEKLNSLITHDLKTPLVAITRTLESIRDKDEIGREQRIFFVNLMIKHCNQSLELINNLLKVQKYELGKMNLFMSEENFNELVKESVEGLKPIADEKRIELNLSPDNKVAKIMMDRTELLRVINNLLGNAIKYTNEGGNIKVISRLHNNSAELRISDDGRGIPVYEQKKIFNFYKTSHDNSETKDEQDISTGLGLYLCKQIVEAHGGQIGFESFKNKGSTFYFTIPVR